MALWSADGDVGDGDVGDGDVDGDAGRRAVIRCLARLPPELHLDHLVAIQLQFPPHHLLDRFRLPP
jgi:hypothetical protein